MAKINENFLKLPGSYLFSECAQRTAAYSEKHPDADIIRLGIGDVTLPIVPSVIQALQTAVQEQADAETFRGYAPDLGYAFLREAVAGKVYGVLGCRIAPDEIFVSDGSKSDCGNIQELFRRKQKLQCVIRFIRSMWIPMSCRDAAEHTMKKREDGAV